MSKWIDDPKHPLCPQCERPIEPDCEPMTYQCKPCNKTWESLYLGDSQGWRFREVIR